MSNRRLTYAWKLDYYNPEVKMPCIRAETILSYLVYWLSVYPTVNIFKVDTHKIIKQISQLNI